jgi:uncharacterized protein (UPF0335 family)
MQVDLDTLKQRVIDATKQSPVADQVEDIALEPDRDEWGTDFLRVVVQVKNIDRAADEDLEALLEAIESTVGAVDERYPSVRFSDAD